MEGARPTARTWTEIVVVVHHKFGGSLVHSCLCHRCSQHRFDVTYTGHAERLGASNWYRKDFGHLEAVFLYEVQSQEVAATPLALTRVARLQAGSGQRHFRLLGAQIRSILLWKKADTTSRTMIHTCLTACVQAPIIVAASRI